MSHSIEYEIQYLLNMGNSPEDVGAELIQKIENAEVEKSPENLNTLYMYLLRSRRPNLLLQFVLKNFKKKGYTVPWGHFFEAVQQLYEEIDPVVIKAVRKGLQETDGKYEACRSTAWDSLIGEVASWRSQKKWEFSKKAPLLKKELLEKLITLRTQQLFDAENNLLKKLEKMFPGDPDILREINSSKERRAYEVLNKYHRVNKQDFSFQMQENTEDHEGIIQSLRESAVQFPEMSLDLAVAAWMIEEYETAYQILNRPQLNLSQLWMRAELQLKTRRYIELLDSLVRIEIAHAADPETFFATALLRAQAFWGLGQKHTAIEILESLLSTRPSYRTAPSLLSLWREL